MRAHMTDPSAKDAGHVPEGALRAFREFRAAAAAIYAFLALNALAQAFFGANGSGFPARAVLFATCGILLWSVFYRLPIGFLRFWGAFCAGLFACLAFNAFDDGRAALLFAYWMSLSVLTIRMTRPFVAAVFVFSTILLIFLI